MADSCTLYLRQHEYQKILETARRQYPTDLQVSGPENAWEQLVIGSGSSRLTLKSDIFRKPQDPFSKLILGTVSWVRNIETTNRTRKERLITRIAECDMVVGIVGEPEFDEAAGHFDCIWAIAEATDAAVFNGSAFLNSAGDTILDEDGTFD